MKRFLCILLSLCLMLPLAGCAGKESNTVSFYYCRSPENYKYFEENGVIQPESRDVTGHRNDLQYLLSLYLAGPLDEELICPFSKSARLLSLQKDGDTIHVELSDLGKTMSDSEFTLACACLTLTCMDAASCEQVVIVSGERNVTMARDSILLFDTLPSQETTGG